MAQPGVGDRVAGRYLLDERIGAGGMGVVWRATDTALHRTVALKQVRIALQSQESVRIIRDRVAREARAAARVQHPHAVAVHDVLADGEERWLVMEYVAGRSLDRVLAEDGALSVTGAGGIGAAVAVALAAAHRAGVVHRDVKPANVLVGDDGTVKLADFGIAVIAGEARLTVTGPVIGTFAYLAPEVADGQDATSASDVFSLGATLYAAVEGRSPYTASESHSNPLRLLREVAQARFREPERAGPLEPVLAAMMQRDPADRPSAAVAAVMLAEIAASPDAPAPRAPVTLHALPTVVPGESPAPVHQSWPRPPRRRRALLSLATACGLVAALLGVTAAARPGNCDISRGKLVIAVVGKLSGDFAETAGATGTGAGVAVDRANRTCAVPGYRLELRTSDTSAGGVTAEAVARSLAADPDVIGTIATADQVDATWRYLGAVFARAGIPQLVYDTRPELTLGPSDPAERPFPTLFRLLARDPLPGRWAARHLVQGAGKKRIAVISDASRYGAPYSTAFQDGLGALGVDPVAVARIEGRASVAGAVAAVRDARPDAVFLSVDSTVTAAVRTELTRVGVTAPVAMCWPTFTQEFLAGDAGDGDLLVTSGTEPALLPAAAGPVLSELREALGEDPVEIQVGGLDATNVVVTAAAAVLGGRDRFPGDREAVVAAVQGGRTDGLAGPISFDAWGDIQVPSMEVFALRGGQLVPQVSGLLTG